jgi:HEAT repeat protein
MIRFACRHCGHKLKAEPDQAGKRCKCTGCGEALTVPDSPDAGAPPPSRPAEPVKRKPAARRALWMRLGAGLLAAAVVLLVGYLLLPGELDRRLNDLKGGSAEARQQAVVWLAQADLQDGRRAQVTAALEPLLFQGDVHKDLDPDVLLRAYLHWAAPDNVPAMLRMVQNPTLPSWNATKTGWVMEALGRLQDPRASEALAEKLPDPNLHDQAVNSLKLLGPRAEGAVLEYQFDGDPETRLRAGRLLADYGTSPRAIAAEARRRLRSNNPDDRRGAAAWYAENPPADAAQKDEAAPLLARLLDDPSPKVNALALQALRLWATRDCLPQLTAYARRAPKDADGAAALIDVLSQFPDAAAAEALALRLKAPSLRGHAGQALAKLGPAAVKAVLPYLNDPDEAVHKEARRLCDVLNVPAEQLLEQTLADVADARKVRSRAALERLAKLRLDEASHAKVSAALNAPLLDADAGIRDAALSAVQVWGAKENTAALLKLLANFPSGGPRGAVIQALTTLRDPAAAPALAEELTNPRERRDIGKALIAFGPGAEDAVLPYLQSKDGASRYIACQVLAEIGTAKSLQPLQAAGNYWSDGVFYELTQIATQKIMARK